MILVDNISITVAFGPSFESSKIRKELLESFESLTVMLKWRMRRRMAETRMSTLER
jgi:hypothetical protein